MSYGNDEHYKFGWEKDELRLAYVAKIILGTEGISGKYEYCINKINININILQNIKQLEK